MKLVTLEIKNFKGIRDIKINADGSNLNIYAENGIGKTTIVDSFNWLLFGKDSNNESNFEIKPINTTGLETFVEAVLTHDENEFTLTKIHKENFTKKRGTSKAVLTGTTTERFINNVPSTMKAYDDYSSSLIDESIFKLITSPLYFNKELKWQDRRKIMLEMFGESSDKEILENNIDKFKNIENLLTTKSTDDILAELKNKKKRINKDLKDIPVRIDEATKSLITINTSELDEKEKISELINSCDLSKVEIFNEVSQQKKVLYKDIDDIEKEINTLNKSKNTLNTNLHKKDSIKDEITQLTNMGNQQKDIFLENKNNTISNIEKIKNNKDIIEKNIEKMKDLKQRYINMKAEKFSITDGSLICDLCKQTLPTKDKENLIKEMKENFNNAFESQKEAINKSGVLLKNQNKQFEELNNELVKTNEGLTFTNNKLKEDMQNIKDKIGKLEKESNNIKISNTEKVDNLINENNEKIKRLEIKILSINADTQMKVIDTELEGLHKKLKDILDIESSENLNENIKQRIEELKLEERKLGDKFNELESQIISVEQFILTKVNVLENKLNSNFDKVTFKLFEQQINEGIKETFVTLIEGVPFKSANDAGKINAGIEIINKLNKHFNFNAPIFIDKRESVTRLNKTDNQVINLIVKKDVMELEVEYA